MTGMNQASHYTSMKYPPLIRPITGVKYRTPFREKVAEDQECWIESSPATLSRMLSRFSRTRSPMERHSRYSERL